MNVIVPSVSNVIDLSSENDEDFEAVSSVSGRKRQHVIENLNENKRNRQNDQVRQHSNGGLRLYSAENQKNVPLKKRGMGNGSSSSNQRHYEGTEKIAIRFF